MKEIGPYTYKEIMEKKNLTYSKDGTVVKYVSVSTLYFDQSKSNGSEFDNLTHLSLIDMVNF